MLLLRHARRAARGGAALRRPRAVAGAAMRPRAVAAPHRCLATSPGDDTPPSAPAADAATTPTQTPTEGWTANPPEAWMEVMNRPQHLSDAVDAITPLGYYPSDLALRYVDFLSTTFDLPFCAGIIGGTFLLRAAMFPLSIITMKHTARMQKAKPELEVLQERLQHDPSVKTDRRKMDAYQRQMGALLAKHNVKPYLIFMFPLAQLPVFMSMFFGLRRAAESFPTECATGGMLWFPDLSVADPTYALPLITSGLFLVMIEVGADGMNASANKDQAKTMKNVMRGMGVLMVPFTYHFPASVFCYWVSANAFSLGQTVLLNKVPGVREALGVPIVQTQSKVRKPTAPPVETVFGRLEKAIDTAKKQAAKDDAPLVAADVFEKKAEDDAFLKSRPAQQVVTHAQPPKQTATPPKQRRKKKGKKGKR